jgi:pimeloyl-ACP methyl ester carboxylesterase
MKLPNAKYSLMSTLLALRKNPKFKERLKELQIPTLIIWGENDSTIPLENIQYFKNIPNSKAIVMRGCGHVPFVEKPLEFYVIMKEFIEQNFDE